MNIRRFKVAKVASGLTQADVSKRTGIHPGTLSAWENGRKPSLSKLAEVAQEFGVSLDWLMGTSDDGGPVL